LKFRRKGNFRVYAVAYHPEFCKLATQTAECPICKNHDPCGTSGFDFYKVAIGGLIAILQNPGHHLFLSALRGFNIARKRPGRYHVSASRTCFFLQHRRFGSS
jgi:hypothetical protein